MIEKEIKTVRYLKTPLIDEKIFKLENINIEELNTANHKLNQYSRNLDELINQRFVTKNVSWFTYTTLVSIVVIIALYILLQVR